MGNVVLVHGAWSESGSVWQGVVGSLLDRGHRVLAVQLPLTSLDEDVAWTRHEMARLDGPVTLVGHSYGGSVISDAAIEHPEVSALVFVSAYAPEAGESVSSLSEQGAPTLGGRAIRFAADGWSTIDPELFHDALGNDLPAATTGSSRPLEADPRRLPHGAGAARRVARPAVRLRPFHRRPHLRPGPAADVRRADRRPGDRTGHRPPLADLPACRGRRGHRPGSPGVDRDDRRSADLTRSASGRRSEARAPPYRAAACRDSRES